MAKIDKNVETKMVKKVVEVEETSTTYTLKLSEREAQYLRALIGNMHSGGVNSSIFDALYEVTGTPANSRIVIPRFGIDELPLAGTPRLKLDGEFW